MSRVAIGDYPAVSPDGPSLAYVAADNCRDRQQRIVVRDLRSHSERSWRARKRHEGGFGSVLWAPDGLSLLVQECGFDSCGVFLLDTSVPGDDLSGPAFGPEVFMGPGSLTIADYPAAYGELVRRGSKGSLVFGIHFPDQPAKARYPILEFDPRDRSITTALPGDEGFATPLDVDAEGEHLLYLGPGGELFRYSGGSPVSLGRRFFDAAW